MANAIQRRNDDDKSNGTVAVVIFIAGAIVLVLVIILILIFLKKRSARSSKTFIPRLERQKGATYGKLEDDEEHAWSADMGQGHDDGLGRGAYVPVHNESMAYQSQTLHHADAPKDTYR